MPTFLLLVLILSAAAGPLSDDEIAREAAVARQHFGEAIAARDAADFATAEEHYAEVVAILRRIAGPRDPEVALALTDLADMQGRQAHYEDARASFAEALDIEKEGLEPDDLRIAGSLANVGQTELMLGNPHAAQPLFEESIERTRSVLGNTSAGLAELMNHLAAVRDAVGDYEGSQQILEEVLALHQAEERAYEIAMTQNNIATALHVKGDLGGARVLFDQSLATFIELLGEDHVDVAMVQHNLATLLRGQGDLESARTLAERSLETKRSHFGEDSHHTADSLNNLAATVSEVGDKEAAEAMHSRALEIRRAVFGDDHPKVAASLNNLAAVLSDMERHEEAIVLLEEGLAIDRRSLGERHPHVAVQLEVLGVAQMNLGDYPAAGKALEQSEAITEEVFGPGHPKSASTFAKMALVAGYMGDDDRARALGERAVVLSEKRMKLLDALSEREALTWLPTVRNHLDLWLSGADNPEAAWTHVLRYKGAVAARSRRARAEATRDPDLAALMQELSDLRRETARLAFADGPSTQRSALTLEKEQLERKILAHGALDEAVELAPAEICAALPAGVGLLDLFRRGTNRHANYLAFVAVGERCELQRVDLGDAKDLDEAVASWRAALDDPTATGKRIDDRGARVTDRLWAPLEPYLGTVERLLVVPDGPLAGAPLGALPIDDGYLLEQMAVSWLDDARDVLLEAPSPFTGAVVVGDVDYDASRTTRGESRGALAPCNQGNFSPLPGAIAESNSLADRWAKARRREPLLPLSGAAATEAAVASALTGEVAVAHIATHGFFATGECRSILEGDGRGFDPMVLSGLALAGANSPSGPLDPDDGILTAAEVAALDLSGTRLVVLSACETGLGEIHSGQGVLGLRRAFVGAGARTLIMSLWSIPDAETALLMDDFYRRHLHRRKPMGAADALRAAQLDALERQRAAGDVRPGEWAAFIASGDWR